MKKISLLQYNAIAFLLPITMFFGIGLSNIVTYSQESFWISILIGIIVGSLIILGFIKVFNKVPEKSIINSGKKIKSIGYFLIGFVFIYIGISILTNLIVSIYLTEINPILIALPLLALMLYAAYKGKVVAGRVSVLVLAFCLFLALSIIISLTPEVNVRNYLPLFNVDASNLVLQGLNFGIYSASPLMLLGLYAPSEVEDHKKYSLLKIYLLSCLMVSIIFTLTVGVMGIEMCTLYRYPEYIVLKRISVFRFVNNIENFNAFFWILTYIVLIIVSGIWLKESVENLGNKKWIYPLVVLIIFMIIIFTTFKHIQYILLLYKYQSLILAGCVLLFFLMNLKKK